MATDFLSGYDSRAARQELARLLGIGTAGPLNIPPPSFTGAGSTAGSSGGASGVGEGVGDGLGGGMGLGQGIGAGNVSVSGQGPAVAAPGSVTSPGQAAIDAAVANLTTFGFGPISFGPLAGTHTQNSQLGGRIGQAIGAVSGVPAGSVLGGIFGSAAVAAAETTEGNLGLNANINNPSLTMGFNTNANPALSDFGFAVQGVNMNIDSPEGLTGPVDTGIDTESEFAPGFMGLNAGLGPGSGTGIGNSPAGNDPAAAPSNDGTPSAAGQAAAAAAGGGGGGGGGGSHICTALYRRGLMDRDTLMANERFRREVMSEEQYRGYSRWARPLVAWGDSHPWGAKALLLTLGWMPRLYMKEIARPGSSLVGRILLRAGLAVCARLGSGPAIRAHGGLLARHRLRGTAGNPGSSAA